MDPIIRLRAGEADLEEWNQHWQLEGDHLDCKACGLSQWPHEADRPFAHSQECSAAGAYGQFPWRDLTWIIKQIKRDLS